MTELQLYTSALIEQNKLEAPTLLIEEYNYMINKAIIQYVNLTYARFDLNQQASDDLRWLQRSVELDVLKQDKMVHPGEEANYVCILPSDYFHMLNCTVHFSGKCGNPVNESKCKTISDDGFNGVFSLCRRLTANQFPAIINNAYLKPTFKRPYYYINTSGEGGKITVQSELTSILEPCAECPVQDWKNEVELIMKPCDTYVDAYKDSDKITGKLMEIRCGKNKGFYPDVAYVDYLKVPKIIELTWDDVQSTEDTTAVCEFPDAVAYEIINIFTKLLLENASDERLQTHYAINQTIGGGIQQPSGK